ncbi:DUF2193 family protein [Archaeoglobus sp.]
MMEDVLDESIRMQETIVKTIEEYRFEDFKISHAEDFVNVVRNIKVKENQTDDALNLYKMSVLNHYEILKKLTDSITPFDSAFLEWMQTPVVIEILYDLDSSFREAAEAFAKAIDESDDLLALEAMRLANGFYGLTSAKDFGAIPGSTLSVLTKIAERVSVDRDYILAILSSKSWGLNTSYVFGNTFLRVFHETRDFSKALEAEKSQMKRMFLEPVKLQADIMKSYGFSSFDPLEYMQMYRKKMFEVVKRARNVHIANVVMLPTHVGDIGHHIGWQYYYICRDEMNMELLRVHLAFLKRNLRKAFEKGNMSNIFDISYFATGLSSLFLYRILWDEGFTAEMLARLFTERFYNWVMLRQFDRNVVSELHVNDFLDFTFRGQRLAEKGWKLRNFEPDFSDYDSSMLHAGELYAYPFCAITTKFATLMKFADMPCLLAPEPMSIVVLVNAVALNPEKPFAPVSICKNCATAHVQPVKCTHCISKDLKVN